MQAIPVQPPVPASTVAALPSLVPGPFIVLLLLPAIPLLLFSVGARPPDTSGLPFSTDDIFQTTAFISVAGAVVLCLGVYPGAFEGIKDWVVDAGGVVSLPAWGGAPERAAANQPAVDRRVQPQGPNLVVEQQVYKQRMVERIPRQPGRHGQGPGGRIARTGGKRIRERVFSRPTLTVQSPPDVLTRLKTDLATRHLSNLREGILSSWYSASKPHPAGAIFGIVLSSLFFIVVAGKLIGDGYDQDARSLPDWIRKINQKSIEEDEKTIGSRVKAAIKTDDKGRPSPRKENELAMLNVELRARGLESVTTEDAKINKDKDKAEDKSSSRSSSSGSKKADKETAKKVDEKSDKKPETKQTFGSRMRRAVLGGRLADSLDQSKNESLATPNRVSSKPVKGGPGWTPADDAVAHAAISQSTNNAQAMADKLAAQKRAAARTA